MVRTKGKIYVGTSGWHYKHWIGKFYPKNISSKDLLRYYHTFFETTELNNSFYRLPSNEQFATWYSNTPKDFLFSVKASRYITHSKRLIPSEGISNLMNSIIALNEKLGPVLFQLPPTMKLNIQRLETFIAALPQGFRYTFEFRHPTWYNENVYRLLQETNCAFCIYELDHHSSPLITTADFVYVRLHGPEEKYSGDYTRDQLRTWADRCMRWAEEEKDVYIYFDNDQNAYAPLNALYLKEIIHTNRNHPVLKSDKI